MTVQHAFASFRLLSSWVVLMSNAVACWDVGVVSKLRFTLKGRESGGERVCQRAHICNYLATTTSNEVKERK